MVRILQKRGVAKGVKPDIYKKKDSSCRLRIRLAAQDLQKDWRDVARNNRIPYSTAYRKPRGGSRNIKLRDEDIDFILGKLEVNPYLTLKEMCVCLLSEKKVKVRVLRPFKENWKGACTRSKGFICRPSP